MKNKKRLKTEKQKCQIKNEIKNIENERRTSKWKTKNDEKWKTKVRKWEMKNEKQKNSNMQ